MIVDMHNHILPGLDDGPFSMAEALLLVKQAAENGVTHIIATAHLNHNYTNYSVQIKEAVMNLNKEINIHNIPIEILPGQEIQFYIYMNKVNEEGLLTLCDGGKYILLELPDDHLPHFTRDVILQILLSGRIPIIPHPERNSVLRKQKQILYELVMNGVLIQITAASLFGRNGRAAKKCALKLIKHNLVHFIASDAHDPISRPFYLQEAYRHIQKKFSIEMTEYLIGNAKHVLHGTQIYPLTPISFK